MNDDVILVVMNDYIMLIVMNDDVILMVMNDYVILIVMNDDVILVVMNDDVILIPGVPKQGRWSFRVAGTELVSISATLSDPQRPSATQSFWVFMGR